MFQYAVGRALALRNKTELRLDISGFENYTLFQGFELERVFMAPCEISTSADIRSVLGWASHPVIRRLAMRRPFSQLLPSRYVAEPYFHYWSEINDLPTDCYLSGYWQSEKYFSDAIAQIRADFVFRPPQEGRNLELAQKIREENAVSLHVRRGDYANNPKTTAVHGLCTLDYYRESIKYIAGRVQKPHFYVFSDDIDWVKANLTMDYPCTYIHHNHGADSYNDMRLMSLCSHHIIANSSFSWWGAWLNPSMEKIVIAPRRWFANQNDVNDLFCPDWVTL